MIKNIADRNLWGNEAADDEDPEILSSYFINNIEFDDFFDENVSLVIVRAKKGMGKSALLNEYANKREKLDKNIVINIKGSDLISQRPLQILSTVEYIHDWQQRICMCINREIGNIIEFAIDDDQILLVENAELQGFKKRNLLGSLIDRFKRKIGSVEIDRLIIQDHKKLLTRAAKEHDWNIQLIIDDIDATFINTNDEIYRLSAFFTACRDLIRNYKGINIRTSLRSDVWASIRKKDEALDKVEQYISDIYWSKNSMGKILAARVESYENRSKLTKDGELPPSIFNFDISSLSGKNAVQDLNEIRTEQNKLMKTSLLKIFNTDKFDWGRGNFSYTHNVLHMYAGGRPRWALQLCRMASKQAKISLSPRITIGHIKAVMKQYGSYRLDDMSREHIHQCPEISIIVNSLSNQSTNYTTNQLINFINGNVINNISVKIDGSSTVDPIKVARYLFSIGLIVGHERVEGTSVYYAYEEKPELLKNLSNLDDGLSWSIHPSFRAALSVHD